MTDRAVHLVAANEVAMDVVSMTRAQAWRAQVLGVYGVLYPWMTRDYVHLDDFRDWLRLYASHVHSIPGNQGPPLTQKPVDPSIFSTARAALLILKSLVLGGLRQDRTGTTATTTDALASSNTALENLRQEEENR